MICYKPLLLSFSIFVLSATCAFSQDSVTTKPPIVRFQEPTFPGGIRAFAQYIANNVKYPEVARIVGITGKVKVTFMVDSDGTITNAKPVNCMGAGCESEAVRVISMSPNWSPGIQEGKATNVQFVIAVSFTQNNTPQKTYMKTLTKSDYGFVFFIKDKTYTVDEAQNILGKSFDPATVEIVENYDNPQYAMPNKKAVYLIVMKNS
jgi:TonB family protein